MGIFMLGYVCMLHVISENAYGFTAIDLSAYNKYIITSISDVSMSHMQIV